MYNNNNNQNQAQNQNQSTNKVEVPEARAALDNMKYEIANEMGINLTKGYNGNLSAKENGSIGGMMVKKMIEAQEQQMAGSASRSMNR